MRMIPKHSQRPGERLDDDCPSLSQEAECFVSTAESASPAKARGTHYKASCTRLGVASAAVEQSGNLLMTSSTKILLERQLRAIAV